MIPGSLEHLALFKSLKLGDAVLTFLPADKADAMAMARYCKEQRPHLYFDEVLCRGWKGFCYVQRGDSRVEVPRSEILTKAEMDEMIDAAGEFYGARVILPEVGGMLYWPKSYTIGRRVGTFISTPPVRTMEQARDAHLRYLKDIVDFERSRIGKGPLMDADSSLGFKYHVQAGVDILCLESMPGDPHVMHSAVRGAARAFGKFWGTHIAMECYGGMSLDELWLKRWKSAIYHAYLCGAGFIWSESGHYTYSDQQHGGKRIPFHSPKLKEMRRILREAYQFARIHTRPAGGPKVGLGVVYGHLDGAPGLWNRCVWGQFKGRKWLEGPAERGWNFVDKFHRKEDWPKETVQGREDFSGNPPYGQYDVVPIEASPDVLASYRCLVFLGWNTMTPAIYAKLKAYVKGGGHLLMYLPHLSTETDRARALKLFRGGDFRDLFGLKVIGKGRKGVQGIKCMANSSLPGYRFPLWRTNTDPRFLGEFTPARVELTSARVISGYDDYYFIKPEKLAQQPVVVENSLGKGKAFLVTAWEYPADPGLERLTEDLLRTVLAGEQGDIRLLASDRARYAVYEAPLAGVRRKATVVYLLNTDPDCAASIRLWVNGRLTSVFEVPSNQLRIGYCLSEVVLLPEDPFVDLKSLNVAKGRVTVDLYNLRNQRVEIHNLGRVPQKISLNGVACTVKPGERRSLALRRRVNPARKEFFAPDFLEETKDCYPLTPSRKGGVLPEPWHAK